MNVPKKVRTKYREWIYIKQVNDKLFLYEDAETKSKMTFSKFELGMINNSKIDKILDINGKNVKENNIKTIVRDKLIKVYDKEIEKEYVCNTMSQVAQLTGVTIRSVWYAIQNKTWIKKRYFVEYKEEKDGV